MKHVFHEISLIGFLRFACETFHLRHQYLSPKKHRTKAYFAYVQSALQYDILAWEGASFTAHEPLTVTRRSIVNTVLQKDKIYRSNRLTTEFPFLSTRQMYIETLLLHIEVNKYTIFQET